VEIREYESAEGASPFGAWFEALDPIAAARVTTALARLALGNTGALKGVGAGVFEIRIDFGPGYRVYLGKEGPDFVILLGGGTKKRQQRDIAAAQQLWDDYKRRKKGQA